MSTDEVTNLVIISWTLSKVLKRAYGPDNYETWWGSQWPSDWHWTLTRHYLFMTRIWALMRLSHESSEHDSLRHIWISRTDCSTRFDAENVSKSTLNWLWMKWATMIRYKWIYGDFTNPSVMACSASEILHWRRQWLSLTIRKEKNVGLCPWLSTRWISYIGKSKWIHSGNLRQWFYEAGDSSPRGRDD